MSNVVVDMRVPCAILNGKMPVTFHSKIKTLVGSLSGLSGGMSRIMRRKTQRIDFSGIDLRVALEGSCQGKLDN